MELMLCKPSLEGTVVEDCALSQAFSDLSNRRLSEIYRDSVHGMRCPIIFGVYSKLGRYAEGARESESGRHRQH